jgi:hypothetical protein
MRLCHAGCAVLLAAVLPRFVDGASITVTNHLHEGTNFLKVTGTDDDGNNVTCPGDVLSPQINLGSISIPGVSKLAYQKSAASEGGAAFVEPAASVGVDPEWLRSHPYLLMKDDTGVEHTGLFAPEFNSTARNPALQSRMVRYQKSLVGDAAAYTEGEPTEFRYLPTGAVDLRRDGNASSAVFENLNRLFISGGKQDGTTIDLTQQNARFSFGSAYDKVQREYPGMLPRWSPHSPFIDPYETRRDVLADKTYRAGRPFHRYALRRCPGIDGTEDACCVSFESSMKVGAVNCTDDPEGDYCGPDNPVASIVRPGTPRPRLHPGTGQDVRVSWRPLGVHTSFSRAVPDTGSVTPESFDKLTKDFELTVILKDMVLTRSSNPDEFQFRNIPSTKRSPKCTNYKTGSLSDKVVMFLEHFYTAVTGDFEQTKHSQRSRSRPWREGETEYVTPDSESGARFLPDPDIKHVLDASPDNPNDFPPSERWAFVPGPPDPGMSSASPSGNEFFPTQTIPREETRSVERNPMFFNDYDTPCTQITGSGYVRATNGSSENIGIDRVDGGAKFASNSRCVYRRTGKYEWMLQAMLQSYNRGFGTVTSNDWWNLNMQNMATTDGSRFTWFGSFDGSSALGTYMWATNRVLFWDLDSTFDAPAYAPATDAGSGTDSARPDFSDFVRLHTTAPVVRAGLVNYTNYRNIRAGLPGANKVVPRITAAMCTAYRSHVENTANAAPDLADGGRCDPCWLAGVWQTHTKTELYDQAATFPSSPVWKGECWDTDGGKPREVTAAMLWNAWSVGSYGRLWGDLTSEEQAAAVTSHGGTGLRWFGAGRDPAELVRHGTSDGTPRTNAHQSICHVDPFVDTEFLITKPDKNAASGFSTFSAGTLWPGNSFRQNGPAEAFQSLGGATDFGNVESPSGSDPGRRSFQVNGGPVEYVERWDISRMTDIFESNSFTYCNDWESWLNPNNYGSSGPSSFLLSFCNTNSKNSVPRSNFLSDGGICITFDPVACNNAVSEKRFSSGFMSSKTEKYQYDQTMNLSAAVNHNYGIHSCADQANRTFFAPTDFGSRGVFVSQKDATCTCCNTMGRSPMGFTIPLVSGAGGEEWDMRWTYYRGSGGPRVPYGGEQKRSPYAVTFDGVDAGPSVAFIAKNGPLSYYNAQGNQISTLERVPTSWVEYTGPNPVYYLNSAIGSYPTRPVYIEDFSNNVRFFSNLKQYGGTLCDVGCNTTTCCPTTKAEPDYCLCNTTTQRNPAGEICTFPDPTDSHDPTQCLLFRTERGDGAIVVGARAARGGTSPATPPAAFGGIRVPAISQLFNADFCPNWNRCEGGVPCQNITSGNFLTYGRQGNPTVGEQNDTIGFWHALDSSAISIGTFAPDRTARCYNALEQGNEGGFAPHCSSSSTFSGNYIITNYLPKNSKFTCDTEAEFELSEQELTGPSRKNWRPPYIHPARVGPELDLVTQCPTVPGTNGPEIRGLDQFSELFDRNMDQRQVGRVSWGARSFGPDVPDALRNTTFRIPDRQYFYSAHEPYTYGKTDGILECASSGNQVALGRELLLHSLLKTADICLVDGNTDDGFTPDERRFATFRDTLSQCYNPADAAVDFCKSLIGLGDSVAKSMAISAIQTCVGLFGTGRQFEIPAEFRDHATDAGIHGHFPNSCFCTGEEPVLIPGVDPLNDDSFLSSLCACGSLARTARFSIGTLDPDTSGNQYDYEDPEFLREEEARVVPNPFCACASGTSACRLRHRCQAAEVGTGTDDAVPFTLNSDVPDDKLAGIKAAYSDTVLFEDLNHTFVSRPSGAFTDFSGGQATALTVPMPFGNSELSQLSECLTSGVRCEVNPASYGDAILTYPIQSNGDTPTAYDRAIILAPEADSGVCPTVGGPSSAMLETLVTGPGANFSVLAAVMPAELTVVPVPCMPIAGGQTQGNDPNPGWHIQPGHISTQGIRPFAQYIRDVAPFTETSVGTCGCLVAWNATAAADIASFAEAFETTLEFGKDLDLFGSLPGGSISATPSPPPPVSDLRPLVVTEDFVFRPTSAFSADRFAAILQSCVQLYDRLLTGTVEAVLSADILSSECFSAFSTGGAVADATGGIEVRVVFPDPDDTGGNMCREVELDDTGSIKDCQAYKNDEATCVQRTGTVGAGRYNCYYDSRSFNTGCFPGTDKCELPLTERVGVSGTCVDAGAIERMFRTSLTEAGTFRVPPVCVSQIKYHLFSVPTQYIEMKNTGTPDPIVLRGTAEFADDGEENHPDATAKSPASMCTLSFDSNSLFLGPSESAPMPLLVPVPADLNERADEFFDGDAGFPFTGQIVAVPDGGVFPDDALISEPTRGNPCWHEVCAAGLGPGGFVVSGAGRTSSLNALIAAGAAACIPPAGNTIPELTGSTCAFFGKDDSNFDAICNEPTNAAKFLNLGSGPASISDLNFPAEPSDADLVAEAPLVAVCHAGMLRRIPRLTGPVFRAGNGAVHTVPPTIAYGRRCALTVRPTAFEEAVPMFKAKGDSFKMVTAAGTFSGSSPEMSVFLADNAGPAQSSVIPLRRLSTPPAGAELVEAHVQHWFSAVLTAPANRHGAGVTLPSVGSGDSAKCAQFFNTEQPGAATAPDQADWHACATAFSLFTLRIPTAAWSAWGAVLADAAGRAAAFVDQSESGDPAEPVCVAGDDGTAFVSDVFPTATVGDVGVLGRLSMAGRSVATAATECVEVCEITLECATAAFYSGVDHGGICTLLSNTARLVSFSTDQMPTISHQSAVGTPPSTGAWMATCVPTLHPFTTRGRHFGATDASVAALVAATDGAVEPCPATGTALHVGPSGTFCVPTSCDHATEFTETTNPFLKALHGRCSAGNIEHTAVANLTEITYTPTTSGSDPVLIWNYGTAGDDPSPPTGPISVPVDAVLKMTFSVQILAPPGAAPHSPGRLSGQIDSINLAVAGSAPKLGMYISAACNCVSGDPDPSCTAAATLPAELFPGQSGLSGNYRVGDHDCNPCAAP